MQQSIAPSANRNETILNSLLSLMDRLEEVLAEENDVLEQRQPPQHEKFIARKNQLLRELMSMQRNVTEPTVWQGVSERMRQVRAHIERNHRLLTIQVQAMVEITDILTDAALAEDADGTYSRSQS